MENDGRARKKGADSQNDIISVGKVRKAGIGACTPCMVDIPAQSTPCIHTPYQIFWELVQVACLHLNNCHVSVGTSSMQRGN